MGSFGKTALSGQISGFSPQGEMGSFGNFVFFTVKRKLSMTPSFSNAFYPILPNGFVW